ncbi:hypothetical protein [Myceligenerans pegani]|uniref:Maltokinase n=1 Tax=Myceligenerans pegani TaxID=2776917 RepID=A0ABR9MYB4_9MICO|nr:hypothetical protein [Myceligenerans sp. TRM 65318]MBE1875919.1 hypothetical protein [Myceligenerans sp. TRM 65318]MBE3018190.1 hypothetical protein [Myceligenerans sp. TRM 65318]
MTIIDQARTVIVHDGAGPLPDGVLRLLDGWLPGRRWYPVPGDGVRHVPWLTVELALPAGAPPDVDADVPGLAAGHATVVVPLLRLAGPGLAEDEGAIVIQVPLVLVREGSGRSPGGGPAPIGVVDGPDGPLTVYDGGAHPAAWHAYLAAALPTHLPLPTERSRPPGTAAGRSVGSSRSADDADRPIVRPEGGWLDGARPLGGEQSNTSVLVPGLRAEVPGFPGEQADGVILKILRTVPLGPHPDVVIPEALTRAGWDGVPRFLGAVELPVPPPGPGPAADSLGPAPLGPDVLDPDGPGPDVLTPDVLAPEPPVPGTRSAGAPGTDQPGADHLGDREAHAHLAVVSELIAEADDGFELACAHAQEGVAFDERAAELGAVVAHLHTALAGARPTDATLDASGFMGVLRRRAAEAIADVPGLAPYRGGVTAFYDEVSGHLARVAAEHPVPLQAIHGDLHLGQVLHARSGWKVLDFEGEPQRPVAERTAPDLPLRDVAGLLRSFDYAAAVGEATDPEWSARAQLSFLEGYRQSLGEPEGRDEVGSSRDHGGAVPGAVVPGGALDVATASLLLRALTLDKALYEAVYEARHRPGWLHIPLNAVARVLDR